MFPAVCQKFVHAMGPETMVPPNSMDAAQDLDLMKIVLRKIKRNYLFWEKVKHTVLDFNVIDLISEYVLCNIIEIEICLFTNYGPIGGM